MTSEKRDGNIEQLFSEPASTEKPAAAKDPTALLAYLQEQAQSLSKFSTHRETDTKPAVRISSLESLQAAGKTFRIDKAESSPENVHTLSRSPAKP